MSAHNIVTELPPTEGGISRCVVEHPPQSFPMACSNAVPDGEGHKRCGKPTRKLMMVGANGMSYPTCNDCLAKIKRNSYQAALMRKRRRIAAMNESYEG
jgi:hypothetical protein